MAARFNNYNTIQPLTSAVSSHSALLSSSPGQSTKYSITKGTFIILLCNFIVAISYELIIIAPLFFALRFSLEFSTVISINIILGAHSVIGLLQMMYPIGGLIADVHCGRYRIVTWSLCSVWCGFILVSVGAVTYTTIKNKDIAIYCIASAGVMAMLAFVVGFSGFQANIVQFGLDQLLDASSENLSLFLHWLVWTNYIGQLLMWLFVTAHPCSKTIETFQYIALLVLIVLSTILVFFISCKRRWFNNENVVANPYQNVYRVLKFAAKHGKPLGHRSALTYSDDVRPSRIDFAKQKFGGIFTTEVVEDVKTFLRILLMLLVITPMFYFEVSTFNLYPIYGLHLGKNKSTNNESKCTYEWMLFESGNLTNIISVVAIPLYILLVYPHIKRWVPRIIYRMGIGVVLKVMSVIFMLAVQVFANHLALARSTSDVKCLFLSDYKYINRRNNTLTLEFPTEVLVINSFIDGIASPLITITVLEFISAQSPHTMKGLLLGVFYAFRGLFFTLGCVGAFPFAQEFWGDYSGILDCGFYYYLSNSVLGVIGLVVFLIAARLYRNRERDDPPYTHQYAEEYYSRYASRPATKLVEDDSYETNS